MSMADKDGFIWYNGELVDWRSAQTHVLTHTLHYGMGVFEGVRAYNTVNGPAIFRLNEHTNRLFNSAHIVGMKLPFDKQTINQAHMDVFKANGLSACYFRPMAFYGSEKLGVAPPANDINVIVAAWNWGAYLGEEGMKNGIRIKTSSYTRYQANTIMCKAKANGNYLNSIMANNEAIADGYDEALMLDTNGFVAEGPGENIFIIRNGVIYTPEANIALEGITRDSIMTIAKDAGFEVIEKRITRDEVYCADEAFFTGTAAEVTPIRELDRRQIGKGSRGPITEQLQQRFFDIVNGKNEQYASWLTYIK